MKYLVVAALLSAAAIIFATLDNRSSRPSATQSEAPPRSPLDAMAFHGKADSACISQVRGADSSSLPCVSEISQVLGTGTLERQSAMPVEEGSLGPSRLSKDGGPLMDPDDPYTWPPYEDSVGPVNDSGPPMDPDDPSTWPPYEDSFGPANDSGPPMDPDDPSTWPPYEDSVGPVNDSGPPMDPEDPLTWPEYLNSSGPVNDSGPPMDPDDPLTWPPYPDAQG